MILVLSEESDITTNEVIDWLAHYRVPFVRINKEDRVHIGHFSLDGSGQLSFALHLRDTIIRSDEITGYFNRRGFFSFNLKVPRSDDREISDDLRNHIRQDALDLNEFVAFMLENSVPHIGEFRLQRVNKLTVLKMAAECGLAVPPCHISENIAQIEALLAPGEPLVTKGISDTFSSESSALGIDISCYTSRVSPDDLRSSRRNIAPTLFQKEIDKLLEVRTFYLLGRCYSMAIISQNNQKTAVDYRRYDSEIPNRNVPFRLPAAIEQQLDALMRRLGLSTGSADFIVDRDCRYYFLEVNPVGQFGALSETCNYQLEKQIAEFYHAGGRGTSTADIRG